MQRLSELARRVRMLFSRRRFEHDLEEEMKLHLELRAAEAGADAARRRFGNVTALREASREAWGWRPFDELAADVRHGLRTMIRQPGFTFVAVLALALGIGASTAILSVVDAVLLRPLPYAEPDRLTVLLHEDTFPVAPANFLDWQKGARSFAAMGAAEYWTPNLGGDRPEQIEALHITPEVLPLLGVAPALGRAFRAGDDPHEVVISHALWQRQLAGDPDPVGRTLLLDGERYTVVGVMPASFRFAPFWATKAVMWAPLVFPPDRISREAASLRIFARLAPGVSLDQARAEVAGLTGHLEELYPGTNRHVTVTRLLDRVVGQSRPALLVLLGAVALVLLIACANVAHMLLARAMTRQREVVLRGALGASRARLVRQLLVESLLLAVLGGGAGLALGAWGIDALVALHPGDLPRVAEIGVDGRVLAVMFGVALLAGVASGLVPALRATRVDVGAALKEGGATVTGRGRLRNVLVASQLALAVMLSVGAGLMIRSFAALHAIDPGFVARDVTSMTVSVAGSPDAAPGRRAAFYPEVVARVAALPGVQSASAVNHLPLAGDVWGLSVWIEGRPVPPPGETAVVTYRTVLPGYFATMGIPVVSGRDVTSADRLDAQPVVVINERLAREHWPGEDPIGKRLNLEDPANEGSWRTVVGVVKDPRQRVWAEPPRPEVYVPWLQERAYLEGPGGARAYLTLVVRSAVAPSALVPAIRHEVRALDPLVAVSQVATMTDVVADSTSQPRFYLVLFGAFAGLALLLAAVGIYGVVSYSVSRRTHEIGIRMALGARRGDVLRMVVAEGARLALLGAAAGLAGALALSRAMRTLLYGVGATDPPTLIAVTLLLAAVAVVASWIPARRASRVDPMISLRHD